MQLCAGDSTPKPCRSRPAASLPATARVRGKQLQGGAKADTVSRSCHALSYSRTEKAFVLEQEKSCTTEEEIACVGEMGNVQ